MTAQLKPNSFKDVFSTIHNQLGEPHKEAALIDEVLVDYLINTNAGSDERKAIQNTATALSNGLKLYAVSPDKLLAFKSIFEEVGTRQIDTSYLQREGLKKMLLSYLVHTDSDQENRSNVAYLFEVLDTLLCQIQVAFEDQKHNFN